MTIQKAYHILKHTFGLKEFRHQQKKAIKSVFAQKDSLVLMPTGGGKSLCYQVPALCLDGLTLVISPLISLMSNQVAALKLNGVAAEYLNSTLDYSQWRDICDRARNNKIKLLYLSPEGLNSDGFQNQLNHLDISLIAIDEAHCVSQWGHEFRKDYIELKWIKKAFPETPLMALTATADQKVRQDIIANLKLKKPAIFLSSFDRPNITYTVRPRTKGVDQIIEMIQRDHMGQCGIVYCQTRSKVEVTASKMQKKGLKAIAYHAGMSDQERKKAQSTFEQNDDIIVVATIAFGMGIDKPNVRFVAHLDMPKNIEGFYQETGRAGRDGAPASAFMLYGLQDLIRNKHFLEQSDAKGAYKKSAEEKIEKMLQFCELTRCRRQFLLDYFDEFGSSACGNCDVCLNQIELEERTQEAQMFLSTVYRTGQRYGLNYNIDVLKGNKTDTVLKNQHHHLSVFGIGKNLTNKTWQNLARNLIFQGLLEYENLEYKTLRLTEKARGLLSGSETFSMQKEVKLKKQQSSSAHRIDKKTTNSLASVDGDLLEKLKELRLKIASEQGIPAFYIFSNKTLEDMSLMKPRNKSEFMMVHGVGEKKSELYFQKFTQLIEDYQQETSAPSS